MKEVRIKLQPKQRELRSALLKYKFNLFGGAKGGGKSYSMRNLFIELCLSHRNYVAVIFRRTYDDLMENHVEKIADEQPEIFKHYHGGKRAIEFPNGSRLLFRHCKREQDATRYRGKEYHAVGIDEADEWTETMFWRIQGSNRSSIQGLPTVMLLGSNPGGVGHAWLKRLFITKQLRDHEQFSPNDFNFIPALVTDNQALMDADPDYVKSLESEPNEALRRAYRYGDWDIQSGQYFSTIERAVHVIEPLVIPKHWRRWGAYDYGYAHPCSWGWYCTDEDGNVYKYRELVQSRLDIPEQAEKVLKFPESKHLIWEAGHDCWAKKRGNDPTIAEEFLNHGIILRRANIDRKLGWARLRMYIGNRTYSTDDGDKYLEPKLFITRTCPVTFEQLTQMVNNPDDMEDVLKVDSTSGDPYSGDDAADETRYSIMTRPPRTIPLEKPWRKTYKERYREYNRAKGSGWTV